MNDLIIKEVNFSGDIIPVIKDSDDVIWVCVRWICRGIGLSDGQTARQIQKIKEDLVLEEAHKYIGVQTASGTQRTLALKIDYLPLWLCKINATPSMRRESPQVVEKLLKYQLQAKDVLAAAFLNDNQQTMGIQSGEMGNLILEEQRKQTDMLEKFCNVIMQSYSTLANVLLNSKNQEKSIVAKEENIEIDEYAEWRKKVERDLGKAARKYSVKKKDVVSSICARIDKRYGICLAQRKKDSETYNTLQAVYDDEMTKSIFESMLKDLLDNDMSEEYHFEKTREPDPIFEAVAEIGRRSNDTSANFCVTYRKIYKRMNVDWGNVKKGKWMRKIDIIMNNDEFMDEFKRVVERMERNERGNSCGVK